MPASVLASGVMIEDDGPLGLAGLTVPLVGAVQATEDPFEPYRLTDPAGEPVSPVTVFLADLQACGRAAATQRALRFTRATATKFPSSSSCSSTPS